MPDANQIFELRRYRLRHDARETLLDLFEKHFVETQEAAGMTLHGFYRDTRDPNAFVWMRSFSDMGNRTKALAAFYGGDVWNTWASAANATMLNSDNVLLLRPAGPEAPFAGSYSASGVVKIWTCSLAPGREESFAAEWERRCRPVLQVNGVRIDAAFVTERSANGFPRLPVREGETVFTWISAYRDEANLRACEEALATSDEWSGSAFPWIDSQLWQPLQSAVLTPTRRSRHGW